MTGKREDTEAMIDETLVESFPASDPPAWTLGVEATETGTPPAKGTAFLTRDAILKLLSDDEIARVSTFETGPGLASGEEYIDLLRPERGVLRAQTADPITMSHVLPRRAVGDETWQKVVLAARHGWKQPESSE